MSNETKQTSANIKFRAFGKSGKWYYSDDEAYVLKDIDGKLFLMEMENFYNNKDIELCIIGEAFRYSGCADRTGTEIYENDIVKHDVYEGGKHESARTGQIGVVGLDQGWGMSIGEWGSHHHNYEIIGNVIENPEMVEEIRNSRIEHRGFTL